MSVVLDILIQKSQLGILFSLEKVPFRHVRYSVCFFKNLREEKEKFGRQSFS
jgi:hypothetical protein